MRPKLVACDFSFRVSSACHSALITVETAVAMLNCLAEGVDR